MTNVKHTSWSETKTKLIEELEKQNAQLVGLLREYRAQPCEGPCDLCRRADEMLKKSK